MELRIEATEHFFMAGEVMVRLWRGKADDGAPVVALVAAVCFTDDVEATAEGLVSIPPPTPRDAQDWAEAILVSAGFR
jgi:hypothetical protein